VIHLIESDWGHGLVKVLWGSRAYGVGRPACNFELTLGLVGSRPAVDRHDHLFFGERCGGLFCRVAFRLLALGESPHRHVVLHHEAFFKIVPDRVHVVGTGCLKKLREVISRLSHLAFEVGLSCSDELLIKIIRLLVVVTLIIVGSDCDPLGRRLGPLLFPLALLFAPLPASLSGAP
jgi:hypothetical protein